MLFIISRMRLSLSIHLLICMLIFLPTCCKGSKTPCKPKEHQVWYENFGCEGDVEINSTNWYLNLNTRELDQIIQMKNKQLGFHIKGQNHHIEIGSPSHGQLIDSQLFDEHSAHWYAEIVTAASLHISYYFCETLKVMTGKRCAIDVSKVKLDNTSLGKMCLSMFYNDTACNGINWRYRSADGSCNNLQRYFLGKATTAYSRLLFPVYKDSIDGIIDEFHPNIQPPNPRTLSNEFVRDEDSRDNFKTMAIAYWTIFIGHDLSHTAVSGNRLTGESVSCCTDDGFKLAPRNRNEMCMQITIPDNDKFFNGPGRHKQCMNYLRSVPAVRSDCTFGPREQMNQATHYLDGSMIYGSSDQRTWSLRTKSNGQLLTNVGCDKCKKDPLQMQYMPLEIKEPKACQYGNGTCYRAGDTRANGLPQLTVMYTLWTREHNRLAEQLSRLNSHWDDERVFQEARKIVIASIQHITYSEWLPTLIGHNYTRQNGLELPKKGYSMEYNVTADPSVSNSFATAVLPFANSMLSDTINLYSEAREIIGSLSLKEHYNRPTDILMDNMDQLVRGLSTQHTQRVDTVFTETLTNYLYSVHPDNRVGMDIFSLDIQRSRDHGIPSYTEFRKYCGFKDISNEGDLSQIMVPGASEQLLKHYKRWNAIDLMVGALLEKRADHESMVGPTMRCIIREQFIRTRIADRYFYDVLGIFNEDKLREIRKVTLARIFCDNGNNITKMQHRVFLIPKLFEFQLCENNSIPRINLNHWAEF